MIRFKWFSGDMNFLQYGGKWISNECQSPEGARFFFGVELINWEDAQGSRGPGKTKYNLSLVIIPHPCEVRYERMMEASCFCGREKEMTKVLRRCHPGKRDFKPYLLQALDDFWSFGLCVPITAYNTNDFQEGFRILREEAKEVNYEFQMEQPVNRIGQTGREHLYGDVVSAICRGLKDGSKEAHLLAKIYGAKEEQLVDAGFKNPFREESACLNTT